MATKLSKSEKKWLADLEAATRYQQTIAGTPSYCTWPTYEKGSTQAHDRV